MTSFNLADYLLHGVDRPDCFSYDQDALHFVDDQGDHVLSYRQLVDRVNRLAEWFGRLNLPPGSRAVLRLEHGLDYGLLFLGLITAGLVPVPCSPRLTAAEVNFIITDSEALLCLYDPVLKPDTRLHPGVHFTAHHDCMPAELSKAQLLGAVERLPVLSEAEDEAFMIYTSGTSGRPKGVRHAQRSIIGRRPMYNDWIDLKAGQRLLHAGEFNWTYTLGVGFMDVLALSGTAVLYGGDRSDLKVWPGLIERFGVHVFAAVPGLYRRILKYTELKQYDLSTLRHGLCAGESLPAELYNQWLTGTGRPLYEALGMSEVSTYISSGPQAQVKPGSPGRAQKGRCVEVIEVNEKGQVSILPPGNSGLIAVERSDPGLMLGYHNRADEEQAVYHGSWFTGGDTARIDHDGYFWYEGRFDDLMNAGGYRVSPLEIDRVLMQIDGVLEAAAAECPVEGKAGLSIITAFIVAEPGTSFEALEQQARLKLINGHCRLNLASYKCPRSIVFVDRLPRSANGKLLRKELPPLAGPLSS